MQSSKRQRLSIEASDESEISEVVDLAVGYNEKEVTAVSVVARNLTDDQKLKNLLDSWGVSPLYDNLHDCGINFENLPFLEECDYGVIMKGDSKMLGNLINFRSFHRKWKVNAAASNAMVIVNVKLILEKGREAAEQITSFFKNRGKFTHSMRVKLVDLILNEGHHLTRPMMSNIADQIVKIFPGELQRYYYEKLPGKQPTGILYRRFNNSQLRKPKSTSIDLTAEKVTTNETETIELTDSARSSMDYLNNENNYGKDMNLNLINKHWIATFSYRNYERTDEWLPLRKPFGDILIHLDFKRKYGQTSSDSLTGFNQFIARNEEIIIKDIRNALVRREVERAFSEEKDDNAKQRIIMMGLFHLSCMVPFTVKTKKKTFTPAIVESKDGFCVTMKRFDEINAEAQKRKIVCEIKGIKEHPMIFHATDTDEYFIKYGSLLYKSKEGFLDAVDSAFKIFIMFNVDFPSDSSKIWHFLNEFFYKVELKDQPNAAFTSMLSMFEF